MVTPIGQALRNAGPRRFIAGGVAAAIIACDLALTRYGQYMTPYRLVFLLTALYVYGGFVKWETASLGLTLRPIQGYRYWIIATLIASGAMLGFLVVTVLMFHWMGRGFHLYRRPPSEILPWFYFACINVPILEEIIYRFVLCVPASAITRPVGAIVISGVVFASLHVVAGVASPDNLVGGFFMAWAFMKSGSLAVPIAWHALGNLCVLVAEVAAWYSGGGGIL